MGRRRVSERLAARLRRAVDLVDDLTSDLRGAPKAEYGYSPVDDEKADPGEVVWAWVTYEENPRRGKDRPVLVVGRDGDRLLALMMSSKDHDLDAADEAQYGRYWVDVGSGTWDRYRRPSEARVDRLLRLTPTEVRRTGAALEREVFDQVMAELHKHHPEP